MVGETPRVTKIRAQGDKSALFVIDGDEFVPTGLCEGPWSAELQFGGAVAALMAQVIGDVPALVPQRVARLTVDLWHPVPIRPLSIRHRIVRQGKRISVVDAELVVDDRVVARASALRLRVAELGEFRRPTGPPWPGPPPTDPRPEGPYVDRAVPGVGRATQFVAHEGAAMMVDPTWVRLAVPVVAGRPVPPLARLAFTADFVSGAGHPRGEPVTGINADITLNVVRDPVGEWVCVTDATGWIAPDGIGQSEAVLSDAQGVVATTSLARLVDRAGLTGPAS
jgi:acyl-coenzyme A thioesterase PaaI-like protein